MTEILAPYLNKQKGVYTAALFPENAHNFPEVKAISDRFRGHFAGNKKNYGDIKLTQFGPETRDIVPLESQDVVLFLLVLQDWMAAGIAEKAFVEAFAALKSGGILGVEQHRSDIGNVQDPAASNGYVQEPFVKQLASEAGFVFVQSSEMNANPKDGKEHPFGVWTLPPQRLSAPRGQAPNPNFNSGIYESIGESDRMVLKFRKP
jgi:predicted methyltransferase